MKYCDCHINLYIYVNLLVSDKCKTTINVNKSNFHFVCFIIEILLVSFVSYSLVTQCSHC